MQLPSGTGETDIARAKNDCSEEIQVTTIKNAGNFRMLGSNVMDRVMAQINSLNDSLLRQATASQETLRSRLRKNGSPRQHWRQDSVEKELGALRSGAQFQGEQMCGQNQYTVTVSLKHVDLAESYLCGYLTIENLTTEHPVLTTFFEGQIIDGIKYGFQTGTWNASRTADVEHWSKFDNFAAQYGIEYIDDEQPPIDIINEPFIYQRWKIIAYKRSRVPHTTVSIICALKWRVARSRDSTIQKTRTGFSGSN